VADRIPAHPQFYPLSSTDSADFKEYHTVRSASEEPHAMAADGLSFADSISFDFPSVDFHALRDAERRFEVWTYEVAKRSFDVAFASLVLLVALPIWFAVAVLVATTSAGPVFFRQQRCGRNGRPFTCYKFRTMVVDAEQQRNGLLVLNEASGPVFKIRRDPRVTRVGRWLRKASIDEVPQLINVLRGEMSVVGPRPPIVAEVEKYSEFQRRRLAVKPGLTCLWQISGRSNLGFEEWVALDLEYIERQGFWYDIGLVLRTIPAVLTGRGAC
jgi:exopolysaccharide biosynthesis polyprenyl glycosylphosphotransferase